MKKMYGGTNSKNEDIAYKGYEKIRVPKDCIKAVKDKNRIGENSTTNCKVELNGVETNVRLSISHEDRALLYTLPNGTTIPITYRY